jgi:hypothetical protein
VLAVETNSVTFRKVRSVRDLGRSFLHELERFFVNYHELTGEPHRIRATAARPPPARESSSVHGRSRMNARKVNGAEATGSERDRTCQKRLRRLF